MQNSIIFNLFQLLLNLILITTQRLEISWPVKKPPKKIATASTPVAFLHFI